LVFSLVRRATSSLHSLSSWLFFSISSLLLSVSRASLSTRSVFSASMPAEQSVGCQPVIRGIMYEDFVIYLSFPGQEGGIARLCWSTTHPVRSRPAIAPLAGVLCPSSGLCFLSLLGRLCRSTVFGTLMFFQCFATQ
jgi:hypothetical protein